MNTDAAERIARAVLYEGYLLYPYRKSSVKNVRRWTFGVIVPRDVTLSNERSRSRAEVVFTGGRVEASLRFLQTESDDTIVEREVAIAEGRREFQFGPISGVVTLTINDHRASVEVENVSATPGVTTREEAIPFSLLSAHVVLAVEDGTFVSSLDPPAEWSDAVGVLRHDGLYPVLASEVCVLAAPIILYDYPRIAPESQGDLFDGLEIDEILSLRILTLTDEEKEEIRRGDPRGRQLLERTEAMAPEQLAELHGALRTAGEDR